MKQWSVSGLPAGRLPLYLQSPLHLPGESHLRCLATWRALCYCREKHSRAILTPPQAYSPLSFLCLALLSHWLPFTFCTLEYHDEKSKSTLLYELNWKEKWTMLSYLYGEHQMQCQSNTSYCITLAWLWFTALEAKRDWKIHNKTHLSVCVVIRALMKPLCEFWRLNRKQLHLRRFSLVSFLVWNLK